MDSRSPPPPPPANAILSEVNTFVAGAEKSLQPLPQSFLIAQRVEDRLKDLRQGLIPGPHPTLDKVCSKYLCPEEITAINEAHDALLLYASLCNFVEVSNKSFTEIIKKTWKNGVWKWILFLYNSGLDLNDTIQNEDRPFTVDHPKITLAIVNTLSGCSISSTMGRELQLLPDIILLVGKMWTEDQTITIRQELTRIMDGFFEDVSDPRSRKGKLNKATVETLLDTFGANRIVNTATTYLQHLGSSDPVSTDAVYTQAHFIHRLARIAACQNAIRELGTLSVVGIVLGRLTKDQVNSGKISAHRAAETLVRLLLDHLLSGPNARPVVHAVRAGLMQSLYNARVVFRDHEECVDALKETIYQVVGPSMVFRSILLAVRRAEKKTQFFRDYSRSSYQFQEWSDLLEKYEADLSTFQQYERKKNNPGWSRKCDRQECKTRDSPDPVKFRCSVCEGVTYCSRECQRLGWPFHRRMCVPEPTNIYPVSDRLHVGVLARIEVQQQMEYLMKRVQQVLVRKPKMSLWFTVDFTSLTRRISVEEIPFGVGAVQRMQTFGMEPPLAIIGGLVKYGRTRPQMMGSTLQWADLVAQYEKEVAQTMEDQMSDDDNDATME